MVTRGRGAAPSALGASTRCSARAVSTSRTASTRRSIDPGAALVPPFPRMIEHAERGASAARCGSRPRPRNRCPRGSPSVRRTLSRGRRRKRVRPRLRASSPRVHLQYGPEDSWHAFVASVHRGLPQTTPFAAIKNGRHPHSGCHPSNASVSVAISRRDVPSADASDRRCPSRTAASSGRCRGPRSLRPSGTRA